MVAVDKKYLDNFVRRLYRFLNKGHIVKFEKMQNERGKIEWPTSSNPSYDPNFVIEVKLDYRDEILATLIHEFNHHEHNDWSESQIIELENVILNKISKRQAKNILKVLLEVVRD